MNRRRRVLVIHYFFPPLAGGGVPRVLKFVKYLPQLGWDVTVVTSDGARSWYGVRDESLLADIPSEVRVVRCREIAVPRIQERLLNPMTRLRLAGLLPYVGWPDTTAGWMPAATAAALRVTGTWRPDVVFSSSFPPTAHLVALAASRFGGVPWVADFRDPWTFNEQPDPVPAPIRRLNSRTEAALVRRADRIIVVDDHYRLAGMEASDSRRTVIANGVDEADVPPSNGRAPGPRKDRFLLTYVGSLYGDRDARPVLRAVGSLAATGRIDPDRFEVRIVGNVWLGDGAGVEAVVPVTFSGYVGRPTALREMQQAGALLFYAPPTTRATSGKIFEYLACGRPILAVARRDNLAYRLVDELGAGAVAEPQDDAGIERAIEELYRRFDEGTLEVGPHVRERTLARFSRRRLTQDLARTLDAAIAHVSRP
jgi:glycosyltransferase involved in cell wall biosynthesis